MRRGLFIATTASVLLALAGCVELPPPEARPLSSDPCRQAVPDTGCWPLGVYVYPPLTDPADTGPYRLRGIPVWPPLVIGAQHSIAGTHGAE